jgi:glyoxylase-like metal-dependent hydrolase (beta-lactamase superfamily II)
MTGFVRINRRLFLARLGKGAIALAVLGACGSKNATASTTASTATAATVVPPTTTSLEATASPTTPAATSLAEYLRVDLGFVSAYVVVRGSEAAVVDTGVSGSEGPIEAALGTVDLDWEAVSHLVLTHHHPDHVGSMPAVLSAAAAATGYIGQGDLDNVSGPRELLGLNDGDEVSGSLLSVRRDTPPGTSACLTLWPRF